MPLRRRSIAAPQGDWCYPDPARTARGTWAYNNNQYYSYGPSPHPHAPAFLTPHPGPPLPTPPAAQNAVISPEDDIQRLFNVCKVGRGNAELLNEVLVYAKPQDLRNEITKTQELLERARKSYEHIGSQVPWATTEAEKSRRGAHSLEETTQEQLLAALLAAHEQLTECLRMYDDLERIAIEQEAEERLKTERLIQALTAIADYQPSPEEGSLIEWVFTTGDPEHTGKINPQTATRIFSASSLSPDALARIWEIASVDSKDGLLDRQGVGVALRLIGHAQKGEMVNESLVKQPGPLAVLENISPVPSEPVAGPSSGVSLGSFPPLTPHDKAKFKKIFKSSGAQNGFLTGDQAREVFMKSKLPWDTLSSIWALADIRHRGHLDVSDFTVAMYLIQALMTGNMKTVPASLPQHIYDEASRESPTPTPSASQQNLARPIHPTKSISKATSPFADPPPPPPRHPAIRAPSQPLSPSWEISPATRIQADHIFSTLDLRNRGKVKGESVRGYMHSAGISSSAAGRIWDLVDVGHKGYLTRDEFAAAMHLVKWRKDGHHIPTSLPPGFLSGTSTQPNDDAYGTGSRLTIAHVPSRSEDRMRPTTPGAGPSGLRSSRSTPHLAPLRSHPPSPNLSPLPTSQGFPMSPLPAEYVPTQPTSVGQWDIRPDERARYDRFFEQLDTSRQGYLTSEVAVPFFARAKLHNNIMATIWDLADSEHDGRLTPDDFAIAMHLIRQKLAGKELPTTVLQHPPTPAPVISTPERPPHRHNSAPIQSSSPPAPQLSPTADSRSPSRLHALASPVSPHVATPSPVPATDPTTVRLPDDDDVRSDTPPPPYELIASDTA